jgi:hypothetical protein
MDPSSFILTAVELPKKPAAWKIDRSDRTELFNNIDSKLTLECALISLTELIDHLKYSGSLWRCQPSRTAVN